MENDKKLLARDFIERIENVCLLRSITLRDVSRGSGLHQDALTHIKQVCNMPKLDTLLAISTFLGVSVSWLIGEKKTETMVKNEMQAEQFADSVKAARGYTRDNR